MDNNAARPEAPLDKEAGAKSPWPHGHCQGHCHCHHGFHVGRLILKIILIVLIFSIGVSVGSHLQRERSFRGHFYPSQNMMYRDFSPSDFQSESGNFSPARWQATAQTNGQTTLNVAQLIGTISKIDGNKITVSVGNQGTVVSVASSTVISAASQPSTLSALKVGQNATVIGSVDNNQQFNAQAINVQ